METDELTADWLIDRGFTEYKMRDGSVFNIGEFKIFFTGYVFYHESKKVNSASEVLLLLHKFRHNK